MEKDTKLLMDYISAWSWQIISIIFFVFGIIMMLFVIPNISLAISISSFILFIITQYIAMKRKKEVLLNE